VEPKSAAARHFRACNERPSRATEKEAVVSTLSWETMLKVAASIRPSATKERMFISR